MRLLGRNTRLFEHEIPLADAERDFSGWFAVVLDPKREGLRATAGWVRAVSKTADGAFRALYQVSPQDRRVTVVRLP